VLLFGNASGLINLNNRASLSQCGRGGLDAASVFGGKFQSKWLDGKFSIKITCKSSNCHKDVTFLSIIGEVVMPSGATKWLKIDQGLIYPERSYDYQFDKFELTDVKPTFGSFCELR
jgi:hypothetical protein